MSENRVSSAVSDPAAGFYPVPDHHRGVVDREWDGDVWLGNVREPAEGASLPKYRRHLFRIFREGGWKLILAFVVLAIVAAGLWEHDKDAKWVSGIQILLPPVVGLGTFIVMYSLIKRLIGRRLCFDRINADTRRKILLWGILAAAIGFAFAMAVELLIPKLFGGNPKDDGWTALAGPAEETGKILLPVILWIRGYFRIPREGYLLVLVSAGTFGIFESFEYGISPEGWQPSRPLLEIMHPLLTGFIAAVAWRVAWERKKIFTGAAVGAWVVAMVAHSTNDVVVLDPDASKALSGITIFVVVGMYLLQKHAARQMVPPDKVGEVSPRWRPVVPRKDEKAA